MERQKKDRILLYISIVCFFLMSLTFLIMPMKVPEEKSKLFNGLIGGTFWLTMLGGIIMQIILSKRRASRKIKDAAYGKFGYRPKIGIFAFAQNPDALTADILCAVSFIAFIGAVIMTRATGYSCYIALSAFIFTFCMHCILNGKIFNHIQYQDKVLAKQGRNK